VLLAVTKTVRCDTYALLPANREKERPWTRLQSLPNCRCGWEISSSGAMRSFARWSCLPIARPPNAPTKPPRIPRLSGGRVMLGLGSGYRPYEFAGFGREFAARHDRQEEAIALILELLHTRRLCPA
jgi:hypothetical protein